MRPFRACIHKARRALAVRQGVRFKTSAPRPLTTTSIEGIRSNLLSLHHHLSFADLELCASDPDLAQRAAAVYRQHGCCVIRGLNEQWVEPITASIERTVEQTRRLESAGKLTKIPEGWVTPDGTLLIPGPKALLDNEENTAVVDVVKDSAATDLQIMVLAVDYHTSSALFQCASSPQLLDVVHAIFDSPNIELFGNGQVVYKEPSGGHTVNCHQDAAFFEFGGSGLSPIGTLNYQVDADLTKDNGPLYIWPGSHIGGYVDHADTTSHLGLSAQEWPLESGVAVEGKAGDSILFHQYLVHASPPNNSTAPRPTFINRYTRPEDPVVMPLATTAENRLEAMARVAAGEKPERKRGYMLRGDRIFEHDEWDLGDKNDGQFH